MTDPLDALRGKPAPRPAPEARARAVAAALEEFDIAADRATKGSPAPERPTVIGQLWRRLMTSPLTMPRPVLATALLAGLALPALLALQPGLRPEIGLRPVPASDPRPAGAVDGAPPLADAAQFEADVDVAPEAAGESGASFDVMPTARRTELPTGSAAPAPRAAPVTSAPDAPAARLHQGPLIVEPTDRVVPHLPPEPEAAPRPARTESYPQASVSPRVPVSAAPVSTFSADVDTASYSRLRRALESGVLPPAGMVRTEEVVNAFDYAYPAPETRETPFRATVTVTDSPWSPSAQLLHVGIKGYEMPPETRPRANLVFLVDTSGSMDAPDKLPLLARALRMLLPELHPEDTVALVAYAGSAGTVLEPTPASDRAAIEAALAGLRAGGGTAGQAGIEAAYALAREAYVEGGANRVILATDGDFNVGAASPDALERLIERQRGDGIGLTVLGFGTGNLRDDAMQALAQAGDGVAAYIGDMSDARHVLGREAQGALFTIAGDVKLQVEFNPDAVHSYRLLGYETRALSTRDFEDDRVDAGEIGAGHEVTAIYEIWDAPERALRYAPEAAPVSDAAEELAYLQIRYKRPGETESTLIATPVAAGEPVPLAEASDDVRLSIAAAGFAEKLRGAPDLGGIEWSELEALVRGAAGDDPDGRRRELADLIDLAGALSR